MWCGCFGNVIFDENIVCNLFQFNLDLFLEVVIKDMIFIVVFCFFFVLV